VKNHAAEEKTCHLRFRSVEGAVLTPQELELVLRGGEIGEVVVAVRFPTAVATHSLPVFADVDWDGRRLGEVAEAIAYW